MTNIVKFSQQVQVVQDSIKDIESPVLMSEKVDIGSSLVDGVWMITVLIWPVLKWVVSFDCVYQLIRMMYHWDTPSVHAVWTFVLHFAVLVVLTYFVSVYKPKDF